MTHLPTSDYSLFSHIGKQRWYITNWSFREKVKLGPGFIIYLLYTVCTGSALVSDLTVMSGKLILIDLKERQDNRE